MSNEAVSLHSRDDICLPTLKKFTALLLQRDTAGNHEIYKVEYSHPILTHYKRYNRGKEGKKTTQKYDLFEEASKLKNAKAHVLSYYWGLFDQGHDSTIATHETNSECLSESRQCRCGERTFRNAVKELVNKKWLEIEYINTGKRNKSGSDKNGKPTYSMIKVCRITITEKSKILFNKIKLSYNCIPRKKIPLASSEATPQPSPLKGGRAEGASTVKNKRKTTKSFVTSSQITKSKEVLTRPSPPSATTTVEQQTISKASRPALNRSLRGGGESKMGKKNAVLNVVPSAVIVAEPSTGGHSKKILPVEGIERRGRLFGRMWRNLHQKTYEKNREIFLKDILYFGKNQRLQDIARVQTHLNYPPLAPVAGNEEWDSLIFGWSYILEKENSRIILQEILPALREFEYCFDPPNPADLRGRGLSPCNDIAVAKKKKYDKIHQKFKNLSLSLIDKYSENFEGEGIPDDIREKINDNSWTLDRLPWMLTTGNIKIDDCRDDELKMFRDVADMIGESN